MKAAFSVFLAVAVWATASAQTKSDREQDRLLGPAQRVKTEVAEFVTNDGEMIEGPRVLLHEITYDARGHRLKRIDYNRDGSAAQTIVYTYDTEGRKTGYEDYTPGLSTPRKHVYVLDEKGNAVEYRIVQPDGSAGEERYVYKYDASGNRISEELYHKTSLISRNENTYDDQGQLTSQILYNPDGSVSARIQISYALDGKPLERIRHDGDLLTYRVRYAYDKKRRLAEVETIGSYVATDPGLEEHVTGKVVFMYKDKDQPKEILIYNPNGSLTERLVLSYDSHGNWIRKTHFIKPVAQAKEVVRQIDYRTVKYH